jgi:hypothetical protein
VLCRSKARRRWLCENHGRRCLPDARWNGALSLAARNRQRQLASCRKHLRMCPKSHQSRAFSYAIGSPEQTTKRVAAGARNLHPCRPLGWYWHAALPAPAESRRCAWPRSRTCRSYYCICRRCCMIWRETQIVDGRDLRRIKWLVQALFGRLGCPIRLVCVPGLLEVGSEVGQVTATSSSLLSLYRDRFNASLNS